MPVRFSVPIGARQPWLVTGPDPLGRYGGSISESVTRTVFPMTEQTDEEIEAELASILRRPPDDLERQNLESWIDGCEVMGLYAKHLVPKDGMEPREPRNCEQCGELFTPPRNDAGALYCSNACGRKASGKRALAYRKRKAEYGQRKAADPESQPT
jgi:hypothetical protein